MSVQATTPPERDGGAVGGSLGKTPPSSAPDSATQLIRLSCIQDGCAQMREAMSLETVNAYAEDMLTGAVFPPIITYFDGTYYWLGDGFHRVEAARKIDLTDILADVKPGTARDAILHGVSANATHGLRPYPSRQAPGGRDPPTRS